MPTYTQQGRLLSVETPLGDDVLLLVSFTGTERLSGLFSFDLELSSENDSIAPADIVGKNITVGVRLLDDTQRFFNGFVRTFAYTGHDDRLSHYRAEMVPWLWFLTRTTDCRIFQNKSVKEIVEQIFSDLGFSDYDDSGVTAAHPKLDYCVQYRETDFQFVSRLLENEGILYFFRHENGKHTLVLADNKDAFQDCPEGQVEFDEEPQSQITGWEHGYEFRSGKCSRTDYNFEKPSASLMTTESSVVPLDGINQFDLYDYPGGYLDKSGGQPLARIRMEEDELAYDTVTGSGRCRTFFPGGKFTLTRHPNSNEENKAYTLTLVRHQAKLSGSYTSGDGSPTFDYHNLFTCIPDSVVFRPPRLTPKPVIHGIQTAVVVGPDHEEIYTDNYGRVKVQFIWDREGKEDDKSSCWVRVAQPWSGMNWGHIYIPRIGMEVVVNFVNGDPDHPLITGCVYNAENMPPYGLPANKTQSGIKSRSSKGGDAPNYNEIRFEDKKDSELLTIHAERDQTIEVENDESHWVGHDRNKMVDHDETVKIKHDRTETVDNNENITIGNNRTESVKKDESITIGGDRTENVAGNESVAITKNRTIDVGKVESITIGENRSLQIAKADQVQIGADRSQTVTGSDSLNVGKQLQINVSDAIVIRTGSASIIMKSDGTISIEGQDISIKGSGKVSVNASSDVTVKGSAVKMN